MFHLAAGPLFNSFADLGVGMISADEPFKRIDLLLLCLNLLVLRLDLRLLFLFQLFVLRIQLLDCIDERGGQL